MMKMEYRGTWGKSKHDTSQEIKTREKLPSDSLSLPSPAFMRIRVTGGVQGHGNTHTNKTAQRRRSRRLGFVSILLKEMHQTGKGGSFLRLRARPTTGARLYTKLKNTKLRVLSL